MNSLLISAYWILKNLVNISFSISYTILAIKARERSLYRYLLLILAYLPWLQLCFIFDLMACIIVFAPLSAVEYKGIVIIWIHLFFANSLTSTILWIEALSMIKQALFSLSFIIFFFQLQEPIKKMDKNLSSKCIFVCNDPIYVFLETAKVKYMEKLSFVDIIADFLSLKLHPLTLLHVLKIYTYQYRCIQNLFHTIWTESLLICNRGGDICEFLSSVDEYSKLGSSCSVSS